MPFTISQAPGWDALIEAAWQAREHAHAPYSGFAVGAALYWRGGIQAGCNVENASYPMGLCAERTALCAAVAQGMKPGEPEALVVVSDSEILTPPCGACRQVLAEFSNDLPILLVTPQQRARFTLSQLLPHPFSGLNLGKGL